MGRVTAFVAALVPVAFAVLFLSLAFEVEVLRWIAYAIFFAVAMYIAFFILIPLLILALGLAFRGRLRAYARKAWEDSKYMLITLGVQAFTAFLSMVLQSFVIKEPVSLLGFTVAPWLQLILLFIVNSYLLIRLTAECYYYMAVEDGDTAIGVMMLGAMIYAVYVFNLVERLGWMI